MRHLIGFLFVIAAPTATAQQAPAGAADVTVGASVLVSKANPALDHQELMLGAHPTDPNKLIACSIVDEYRIGFGHMRDVAYVSSDGGRSWMQAVMGEAQAADPVCKFGPDGAAYFTELTDYAEPPYEDWEIIVHRSPDGGASWTLPSFYRNTGDRPWLTFDGTNTERRGRMYLAYQSRVRYLNESGRGAIALKLGQSRDNGATWSTPAVRALHETGSSLTPTGIATLSDGTIVISWLHYLPGTVSDSALVFGKHAPNQDIRVTIAPPGGDTLGESYRVSDKYSAEGITTRVVDALAADTSHSPFRDRLYLAWTDQRLGRSQILLSYSADRGKTWSVPRVIDDDRVRSGDSTDAPNDFMPTLAVNKDGVVSITWYDRRDNPDNAGFYLRFRASLDGGETWLPSVRVSDAPFVFGGREGWLIGGWVQRDSVGNQPTHVEARRNIELHGGDTNGLAADASGVFHALWVDDRTGINQVYTAPIAVRGTVVKNGSAELATRIDVSRQVAIELTDASFDGATGRLTLNARLRNKSQDTITAPIAIRVVTLSSPLGIPRVLNADNSAPGEGAVWDFPTSTAGQMLAPGDTTRSRSLVFHLSDLRPFRHGANFEFGLVSFDARVLARATEGAKHQITSAQRGE